MPNRLLAWVLPVRPTSTRARRATPLRCEWLEDRTAPANLTLTGAILVDSANLAQPSPYYGQQFSARANWLSQSMAGEPAVPVRFTANYPVGYFTATSPAVSYPLSSNTVNHGSGSGSWNWWLGGWYAGAAAFSVTVQVDPDNVIAETNEADNTIVVPVTPIAPTTLPEKLLQPIGLTPNRDWTITNYADIDPRSGTLADYRLGTATYDGHDAIDAGPVDFAAQDRGVPIVAVAGGTVDAISGGSNFDRETSWNGGQYWNAVFIDHGNGWRTEYGHLAADSIAVRVGTVVKPGQILGLMGSSGVSSGTHTHYTLFYNNQPVEVGFAPTSYWKAPLPYTLDLPGLITDSGITNYSPFANAGELQERPAQYTQVGTADPSTTMYFYLQGYNLKATDVMYWQWVRPNGTVLNTSNFSPSADYRYSTWWWSRPQSGFTSATGTWTLINYLNGTTPAHEQKRTTFEVVSGPGTGSIRLTQTPSGYPVIDGRTTPIDLGTAARNAVAANVNFTVTNHGNGTLGLSNFVLPPGVTLVSAPATLGVGLTGTIAIRLDTATVGTKYGSVRFDTTDTDVGTFEFVVSGQVTGTAPAAAPVLDTGAPATAFNFGSLPRRAGTGVTVTDSDSANFAGGTLVASFAAFAAASDRLGLLNLGTAAGQIGVSGTTVTYGGTTIGSLAGGGLGLPLTVSLNAGATPAATQALARALSYQSASATPTTQRKAIRLVLTDESGNASNALVIHVVNSGFPRNPSLAALPARTVTRGNALTQAGSFADPYGNSWAATVDYGDGAGPQALALNVDKTFTLSHTYLTAPAVYATTVTVTSDTGGVSSVAMSVTVALPVVSGVSVNAGAAQRSRVTDLGVTFGGTLSAGEQSGLSYTLTRARRVDGSTDGVTAIASTGASPQLSATYSTVGVNTVAALKFVGGNTAGVQYKSLADGVWQLVVKAGATVVYTGPTALATAGSIYRLFGDADGDKSVSFLDSLIYEPAFGSNSPDAAYVAALDANDDGSVGFLDALAFEPNFGVTVG